MPALSIRPYEDGDEDAVLALLGRSLGKVVDDRYRSFFRWKHHENPFGRSFAWVAHVDGQLAGFRTFMRWRFVEHGTPVEAVRAVDTATDPAHRGAGVFRALTLHGLDELRGAGIAFVFNTPNDQSRPGYLKMGWQVVGRVPVQVRARAARLHQLVRARTAAELWSEPSHIGSTVDEALADRRLEALLDRAPHPSIRTARDERWLAWRFGGFGPTSCRVITDPGGGGMAFVRVRRRGDARECAVEDILTPDGAKVAAGRVATLAMRQSGADYAIASRAMPGRLRGWAAVDRLGPVLTFRAVTRDDCPPLERWQLALGDVALF